MQDMFRADGHSGHDLLDRDAPAPISLVATGDAEDWQLRRRLGEARALAGVGDHRMARVLCAEVVFKYQPRLARDRELLRLTIATMIHARGFQMLGRLLAAVHGWRVRIVLGEAGAPLIDHVEAPGVTGFTVSELLYADASRDAVIERWSEELAWGRERPNLRAAS